MSSSAALRTLSLLLLAQLSLSATNLYVTPGSTLILHCIPSGHLPLLEPSFFWTRVPQQDTLPTQRNVSSLSINKVGLRDTGAYECMMEGFFDKRRMRFRMVFFVEVADAVDYQQEELVDTNVGDSVTLSCPSAPKLDLMSLSDGPDRLVTWYRKVKGEEEEIILSSRWEEKPEESIKIQWDLSALGRWSIKINHVTMEDSGMYYCQWKENGKQKNHVVELIVKVPPTLPPPHCNKYATLWEPCEHEESPSGKGILAESLTEFSMNLYSLLSQSDPSTNVLFSPVSIAGVLTHLLLGARGRTREILEEALRLPLNFSCVHSEMRKMREDLNSSMEIASQIYYSAERELEQTFMNQSELLYGSSPQKLTNNSKANMKMINNWVAEKTHQRITHLVDSVSPAVQLLLLNTVYFNGKWKVKFQRKTEEAQFITATGELVSVPVLYSPKYNMVLWYSKELKAQVAALPLSGQAHLLLLLPANHLSTDLKGVESNLNDRTLRDLVKNIEYLTPDLMEVTLPIVKLDIGTDLTDVLNNIGLSELFGSPNLCGLSRANTDPPLMLSEARHHSFLSLTESGVEAGAATAVSFSRSFPSFSALRPFLFILWSNRANCPLFLGRVVNPAKAKQ